MPTSGDGPTIGELARQLAEWRADIRDDLAALRAGVDRELVALHNRLTEMVSRDRYDAEQQALRDRIARLEADRQADQERLRSTRTVAVTSFIAPILVGVILAWLLRTG